jgi:hypothetical protein
MCFREKDTIVLCYYNGEKMILQPKNDYFEKYYDYFEKHIKN